jgi:hypothetical protein
MANLDKALKKARKLHKAEQKRQLERPAPVIKMAHIPGPRRKPKFAFSYVPSEESNVCEVGDACAMPEVFGRVEALVVEDSAGPKDRAEDEDDIVYKNSNGDIIGVNDPVACDPPEVVKPVAKTPKKKKASKLEKPMTLGSVDE